MSTKIIRSPFSTRQKKQAGPYRLLPCTDPLSEIFARKRGNGPMCAASNRSRERENKNENRDNYLRGIIYYMHAENLLRFYEQFVNNAWFLQFFVIF